MNEFLIYFTQKYKGDWDLIYKAFKKTEKVNSEILKLLKEKEEIKNKKYITILDEDYPKKFNTLYKPPFAIYYEGNKGLLNKKIVCITGNLENKSGQDFLSKIDTLSDDYVFISEGWVGFDNKIVEYLIKKNKNIIIVLASGIKNSKKEKLFANYDKKKFLLISEYPNEYHVTRKAIYARNRIVACLADNLIILASQNKKMMPLVDNFIEQNKIINCVKPDENETNNDNIELINSGAILINDLNNI
ncbi:DNA-processing protein DprA [Metamycoplasma spumans]|uniref:DNA-processing protein DprA n=1 Tax=Metamycoplasma spumans TaxID=92406 RepID=UPI0034DD2058